MGSYRTLRMLILFLSAQHIITGCATKSKYTRKRHSFHSSPKQRSNHNIPTPAPLFDWPIRRSVVFYGFDSRPASLHEGISIGAPKGTPVKAAGKGEVVFAGTSNTQLGKMVMIAHDQQWISVYAELGALHVRQGDHVQTGATIGTVGDGDPHGSPSLFFQLRYDREAVDPVQYLKR